MFALLANGALMLAMPIALVLALRRWAGGKWSLAAGGALAFVVSQMVHVPILWGVTAAFREGWLPRPPATWTLFDPIFLGLAAAACEEPARALLFARVFPNDRDARSAAMAGAGHGGIEALFLGFLVLVTWVNMVASRGLSAEEIAALGVPADQAAAAVLQIAAYFDMPWYLALLGAAERAITLPFHVACSLLVAASVRTRSPIPFAVAFLAHAGSDGLAVWLSRTQTPLATEAWLAAACVPFSALAILWAATRAAATAAPRSPDPKSA
jgi:uncharacterized membrane protein YhfC